MWTRLLLETVPTEYRELFQLCSTSCSVQVFWLCLLPTLLKSLALMLILRAALAFCLHKQVGETDNANGWRCLIKAANSRGFLSRIFSPDLQPGPIHKSQAVRFWSLQPFIVHIHWFIPVWGDGIEKLLSSLSQPLASSRWKSIRCFVPPMQIHQRGWKCIYWTPTVVVFPTPCLQSTKGSILCR